MNKDIGIFVPARLDSKRLPQKQILPIGNSCMFEICCQKLEYITKHFNINTYVLICDKELIEIAEKFPSIKIVLREESTVQLEGPLHYIYKDILTVPEKYLLFLNPCLIFLTPETIYVKIQQFLSSGKDYGTSVKKFQNWIWDIEANSITPINYERLTTKEVEGLYQAAHCFHIFNKEKFIKDGNMLGPDICLLEIPEEETIDIDTEEDYLYAKWKYETCSRYRWRYSNGRRYKLL